MLFNDWKVGCVRLDAGWCPYMTFPGNQCGQSVTRQQCIQAVLGPTRTYSFMLFSVLGASTLTQEQTHRHANAHSELNNCKETKNYKVLEEDPLLRNRC